MRIWLGPAPEATRAYEVAAHFRRMGMPVVMAGIHATMCLDEAAKPVEEASRLGGVPLGPLCPSVRNNCAHPLDPGNAGVSFARPARN